MLVTSTETTPGREVKELLGPALGNTIRARNLGAHLLIELQYVVGGEISE